ncbi:MAG: TRAP transporter substrate-binding protein DctP, partial [Pseudomonadota bacterium]
ERFAKEVQTASKGTLKVSIVDASKVEDKELDKAVVRGQLAMASLPLEDYDELVPAIAIFEQPFMFFSSQLRMAATARNSLIRAPIEEAIRIATNERVLWWQPAGAAVFVGREAPASKPSDITGKRVHVSRPAHAEFVKLCGGTPVVSSEIHNRELLETKKVDFLITALERVDSQKLWETAKSIVVTEHEVFENVVVINEGIWQSLSDEHKSIMEKAAKIAEADIRRRQTEIDQTILQKAKSSGLSVDAISKSSVSEWKYCDAPMLETYLTKAGRLGRTVLDGYREILISTTLKGG